MLHVESITKSYNSSAPVISNFSFSIEPQEVVFLIGPSGVGKSTLLKIIANLERYDSGKISLHNKTPCEFGYSQWRRDVLYVSQNRPGVKGTPVELLQKVLHFRSRSSSTKLDDDQYIEQYLKIASNTGLTTENLCNQTWSELSGGQAQRAYVTLCVVLRPQILLLDEPSSSCDQKSTLLIEKVILQSQITAIWVSHDPEQPKRVPGRIVQLGANVETEQ